MLYLEDFHPGDVSETRAHTITRDEIVTFARQFDPQQIHLADDAPGSPYGGMIASGWHTASLCMRLVVDFALADGSGNLGSPGVDELRWTRPVRPGDTLSVRVEVVEAKPSRSKPDRGLIRLRYAMRNQNGEEVLSMIAMGIVLRRPAGEEG
jgi:acyl dehydratase